MMALVIKDRIRETTTTAGTGSVSLDGAVLGYATFASAMAVGDTTYYTIAGQGTNEWEVGIGTLSNATTLARTTVLASSNSGAIVTFSAGAKDVFITYPAVEAVPKSFLDGTYETVSFNTATNVYSSGSWVVSPNINANETANVGVTFSTDGLNMYTSGDTSDAIDQYSLTRAFDVSSISYLRTFSVSAQTTQPRGITFSPDGLNMYIVDDGSNRIIRYVLGTAWNISTAATPSFFVVTTQTQAPGFNIQFSPNGLTMIISDQTSALITYTLTTPWVIASGVTFTRTTTFDTGLRGFVFSSDGLQLFTYTLSTAAVFRRRTLGTAFNTATAGAINQTIAITGSNFPTGTYGFPAYSLHLNAAVTGISAGQRLFIVSSGINTSTEYVYQFELSAANDISLMLSPLFDVTTATSRQVSLNPGTTPVYIARLGTPGVDFLGMTKQIRISAATVMLNNNSYIKTVNGANQSLAAGDILQVTHEGSGVWAVTDVDNQLKTNLFNLQNAITAGFLAFNPSGNTFTPRIFNAGAGISVSNNLGGGDPTFSNTGIRSLNQRTDTDNISTWWHRTFWSTYGEYFGSSPWLNNTNQGTFFFKQIGGGFNNTDTPDLFYWDKNSDISSDSNYPGIGYPRASTDKNAYLRRFYFYSSRWYQREMIYMGEANWYTNPRATRAMSELVLGVNWLDSEDCPDDSYYYGYAIPFQGSATQVPTGTSVTGNFLISGTTAAPTILSQAVTTTSVVNVHMNGRSFVFTAWTADGAVSIKYEGGGYTPYLNTITFAANTTFYYNYWCEGDITARTFVKVFFSSTATANWSYAFQAGDMGDTIWRAYIQNANRANYIGNLWRDGTVGGYVFPSARVERIWTTKSLALPLTTNAVTRTFTIQCRFRVDDITTQDQNVFWIANAAAPTNPNGIRVRINEGTVDRRLSVTLGTTANATTTGNIVDRLRVWQFNATQEWIILTFVWNPLDTTFAGRLYVNGAMMYKTNTNPFGTTTAWHNIGSTVDGTANGFVGYVDYLQIVPECWGAYVPQGTALIDVDTGNAAWTNSTNNGGQDVPFSCRNNFGFRGYLRGSSWGVGANIRTNTYWDGPIVGSAADSFTLTCDLTVGLPTGIFSKTTAGFPRNTGRFLVTGTGIPTTNNVYAYIAYGDKDFYLYEAAQPAYATSTVTGTTLTFVRCNGSAGFNANTGDGGYLQMPDNAIFVAKSNNISATFTNELAGVNSGATTASCAFPDLTFTATGDAAINDIYTTQISAANNTTVRALQAALAIGPKQYTLSGSGLTATSATIDNARVIAVTWDGAGPGLHQIQISRNRDTTVAGGTTITARFVPNAACGYLDFDLLGGDSARDTANGESDGYSPDEWWYSSQRDMKTMLVTAGIGQWRYTRVSPPGCVYDSGIFKATATTFARNMYLGYGARGYLITYGTTGDYNQSTVNPVVAPIAYAASNGMNSDGFSLTVVVNTFYRVIILPFGTSLIGDFIQ